MYLLDPKARLPEIMSLKGILSSDLPHFVEGFLQSIGSLIAGNNVTFFA